MIKLNLRTNKEERNLYFKKITELMFFVESVVQDFYIIKLSNLRNTIGYKISTNDKEFVVIYDEEKKDFRLSKEEIEEILNEKAYNDININVILDAEMDEEAEKFMINQYSYMLSDCKDRIPQ